MNKTPHNPKTQNKINWSKLVNEAKNGNGGRRQGSGLRQHIREVLSEVPEEVRKQLQNQSIGVWCQVLRAVLKGRYEVHAKDRMLYNKIRVNLTSWKEFEVDEEGKVKYLKW